MACVEEGREHVAGSAGGGGVMRDLPEVHFLKRDTSPKSLTHVAHHEAGHAVMFLMFGHYIKSISIVPDPRQARFGIVKTSGPKQPRQADVLCSLAGPVAELFYESPDTISADTFDLLFEKAAPEGVFDELSPSGRPRLTIGQCFKSLCMCIEIMGQPDFRDATTLLAERLLRHSYLCHGRVIRQRDVELWEIYSTSAERISQAKLSPNRIARQMFRSACVAVAGTASGMAASTTRH
jgi:hypothetical protein